jgi:hypothetical protein
MGGGLQQSYRATDLGPDFTPAGVTVLSLHRCTAPKSRTGSPEVLAIAVRKAAEFVEAQPSRDLRNRATGAMLPVANVAHAQSTAPASRPAITTGDAASDSDGAAEAPLMAQINNGNWLDPAEASTLRDELFVQNAIHAYIMTLPALNVIGMREGSEVAFGQGHNVLAIWKDRTDSRCWVPTPNADVTSSMSDLNLKETGPLVVAAPANVIGMFTDFFQRTITDVGSVGPTAGAAGSICCCRRAHDRQEAQ